MYGDRLTSVVCNKLITCQFIRHFRPKKQLHHSDKQKKYIY